MKEGINIESEARSARNWIAWGVVWVNDGVRVGEWWGQRNTLCNPDSISTRNLISCWSLCSDELAQLKMYFTSNTHTMNDIRNTLRENSEQLVILGGCFSLLSFFSFTKHWKHVTYLLYCLLVSRKERTEDCGTRRSPARQGALVSFLWLNHQMLRKLCRFLPLSV